MKGLVEKLRIIFRPGMQNRGFYYFKQLIWGMLPGTYKRLKGLQAWAYFLKHKNRLLPRLNYYNKLESVQEVEMEHNNASFPKPKRHSVYYFDLRKVVQCLPKTRFFNYLPGDVTRVPETPSFVKSRPVHGNNSNAIVLKLNAVRHFNFVKDPVSIENKKKQLVWRGFAAPYQKHRVKFLELYYNHPMCNVGKANFNHPELNQFFKEKMSIQGQMQYAFILTIEGNDVATNLKWVMASNSIAVMPPPTYETWFMEGKLIPDVHYLAIRPDFSDVEERLKECLAQPEKMKSIVKAANAWVKQFQNPRDEKALSIAVANKYCLKTGQKGWS